MRITTRAVFDIETGNLLERKSFEYSGPIAELRGSTGQTQYNDVQTAKDTAALQQANQLAPVAAATGTAATNAAEGVVANPGYTPAEQTAITGGALSGVAGSYDAAAANAANRVNKTNNSAGYSSLADTLARGKAQGMSKAAAGTAEDIANARMTNQQQGIGDLGGIYNTQLGATTNLLRSNTPNFTNQKYGISLGPLGTFGGSV